jgi:hypothetical protein
MGNKRAAKEASDQKDDCVQCKKLEPATGGRFITRRLQAGKARNELGGQVQTVALRREIDRVRKIRPHIDGVAGVDAAIVLVLTGALVGGLAGMRKHTRHAERRRQRGECAGIQPDE